jgi:hypothetical protein
MPDPWERGVQKAGRLTVFATKEFLDSGNWGSRMFDALLEEFNRLAEVYRLGVRMDKSQTAPDPKGPGANVNLTITDGTCKYFDAKGDTKKDFLDVSPKNVRGRCISYPAGGRLLRAFIFVPAFPQYTPGRLVGPRVRMALAIHELLHACGLLHTDPGHGSLDAPAQGDLDVFATAGDVVEEKNPDLDWKTTPEGKPVTDSAGRFFLTPRTVRLIQDIWLLGQL